MALLICQYQQLEHNKSCLSLRLCSEWNSLMKEKVARISKTNLFQLTLQHVVSFPGSKCHPPLLCSHSKLLKRFTVIAQTDSPVCLGWGPKSLLSIIVRSWRKGKEPHKVQNETSWMRTGTTSLSLVYDVCPLWSITLWWAILSRFEEN